MKVKCHTTSLLTTSLLLITTTFLNCASTPQNKALEKNVLIRSSQVNLPNVSGRIDHITYDAIHHLAFIAALGNNTVEVVDLSAKQVIHTITGLQAPQGIVYIPSSNKLVVANDGGSVIFFDAGSFKILSTIDLKDDADNVRYDESSNTVYVGYGNGGIAIIDANTMKQTGTIQLDGHPESFQLDKKQNHLYVNVPDADKIEVADLNTNRIIASWKNINASSNFPMAFDEQGHRLFIGCRSPAKLRVVDTQTGKDIASMDCSGDADDVFFYSSDSLIFISTGKGFIDVFKAGNQNQYTQINQIETRSGARTSLWLPEEKKLLLAVPIQSGEPAALWIYDYKNE